MASSQKSYGLQRNLATFKYFIKILIMILKSRKSLSNLLTPFRQNLKFQKSQKAKLTQSERILEGKAYLSDIIINKIANPDFNLQEKSMRQHLIDLIDSTHEVPEDSRIFMRRMFTTGIPINQKVFCQDRIEYALNKSNKERLFIFCPTRLVTSKMFKQLIDSNGNTLFTGHYGISKTVSVMLYSIMSNIIAEYKFKTFEKEVTTLGARISQSPKVFYININDDSVQYEYLKLVIHQQCRSQISKQNRQKVLAQQFNQKNIVLRNYYLKNDITTILLVDQLSRIASMQRRANSKQVISGDEKQSLFKKIQLFKKNHRLYLKGQFRRIHFLGSSTIQREFISDLQLGGQSNHTKIKEKSIAYFENISQRQAAIQIIDLFLFEMQRTSKINLPQAYFQISQQLKQQLMNEKDLKKLISFESSKITIKQFIRIYLLEKLLQFENFMLTFCQIRQAIQNQVSIGFLFERQAEISLPQLKKVLIKFEDILEKIKRSSQEKMKKQFYAFLAKTSTNSASDNQFRHYLIYSLITAAQKAKVQPRNAFGQYQLHLQPFHNYLSVDIINKYLDRRLFIPQDNNIIKTYVTPKNLISILQPKIIETISFVLFYKKQQLKKYQTPSSFGSYVELVFTRLLDQVKPNIVFIFGKQIQTQIRRQFQICNNQRLLLQPIRSKDNSKSHQYRLFQSLKKKENLTSEIKKQINLATSNKLNYVKKSFFLVTNNNYYPSNSPQFKNFKYMEAISSNDNAKSQKVDFAIAFVEIIDYKPYVRFIMLDVTNGMKNTISKINSFLHIFNIFIEKNETMIRINDEKELTAEMAQISLDYFVLTGSKDKKINLKAELEKTEKKVILQNLQGDYSQIVKVKGFKDQKPSLLKSVGYISIGQRCQVTAQNKNREIIDSSSPFYIWQIIKQIINEGRWVSDE